MDDFGHAQREVEIPRPGPIQKARIVDVNGNTATITLRSGETYPFRLRLPKGSAAAPGDIAYVAKSSETYVILVIQ